MFKTMIPLLALACAATAQQQRVDPRLMHNRVIAVVPLTGAGTHADPIRPLFTPVTQDPHDRDGIISFSYQLSDDGKSAIVEFVAVDRKALKAILEDSRLTGKVFERGKDKKEDIERELKKHKRDFRIDTPDAGVSR